MNAILLPPAFAAKAAALRSLAAARGSEVMATASFRLIVRDRRDLIAQMPAPVDFETLERFAVDVRAAV